MSPALPSPDDWRAAGRTFSYRGQPIFYRDSGGEGRPALLLIHGFPTASWDFYRVWDALAARFRLIAPDLIGFGLSAKPKDYDYSLLDQATLCTALCAQLGIGEAHLLAHDYGVSIAQELLARHEQQASGLRPASIALLNGGLFPETHRALLVQKLLRTPIGPLLARGMNRAKLATSMRRIFGPNTQPSEAELDAFWQLIAREDGPRLMPKLIRYIEERRAQRGRWVPAMQRTRVPMRLINGPVDPVSGAHMVARYRELIPDPDVVLLPEIGHYPQVEAPEGVLAAFFAFHDRRRS